MPQNKIIYSKSKINRAGSTLINENSSSEEKDQALVILDTWRAIHKYPLHIFKKRLKKVSERIDKEALVVQRLKRLPSIIKKLQRKYYGNEPTMNLSQMQDIAGCRAVVKNVDFVRKIVSDGYVRGDIKHQKVNEKDYITYPKPDGYRSVHLIYRYKSDKNRKRDFNGLLVEVQIRSKLQHLWATAIETVDLFTSQAIKSNEGKSEWMEFFKLVSSAFALMENCPLVPGTPQNIKDLYSQIKIKEKELQVINIMSGWTQAVKIFEREIKKKAKWQIFLLELDILGGKLNITGYPIGREESAISDYSIAEKRNQENKQYDVVLVGVNATNDLRKAYPNYFADTKEFLDNLRKIISKSNN